MSIRACLNYCAGYVKGAGVAARRVMPYAIGGFIVGSCGSMIVWACMRYNPVHIALISAATIALLAVKVRSDTLDATHARIRVVAAQCGILPEKVVEICGNIIKSWEPQYFFRPDGQAGQDERLWPI